jgi:hypothetical protein
MKCTQWNYLLCVFFLQLIFIPHTSFSQKENNIWMMSQDLPNYNCGIDFNNGAPDTFSLLRDMDIFLLNASICDTSGMLLFYTNGQYISNRNHDTLLNSIDFNPGWLTDYYAPYGMGLPQGIFIIPRPGHPGKYFVFHESGEIVNVDGLMVSQATHLSCSMIDMTLDGGMGGIDPAFKNVTVIDDTLIYGRLTGVKHANGRDWWIVAHRSDSDLYYKLLITPDSIYGPYHQNIGRNDKWEHFTQQCAFSPGGDKYVIELSVDKQSLYNVIDLLDFDRCTGEFSNERHIEIQDSFLLAPGCSFSPDSRFLYISNQISIFQYDTWDSLINLNAIKVAQWDSFVSPLKTKFYYHLLAPDNKIYISTSEGTNVLHFIDNPNQQGIGCNVVQNSFFLPSNNNEAMPNAANYNLGPLNGSLCDTVYNGIAEILKDKQKINVFPNPASNEISIALHPENFDEQIQIQDMTGRILLSTLISKTISSATIDLSKLSRGSYILTLKDKFSATKQCQFNIVR